jgi:hypothetical protein
VHIVETRMSCTVCLKSSCLLICFRSWSLDSWSLDLSQTLIQTIQILKDNFFATTMEKQKTEPWPCPGQFLLRSVNGSICLFFLCSRGICYFGPKMPKPMEKPEKQNKQLHPMPPVQFLRPSLRVDFFLCFWLSRGFCYFGPKVPKPMEKQKTKS